MKQQSTTFVQRRQPLYLVRGMTLLYCKRIHRGHDLCLDCAALIEFETQRISQCTGKEAGASCRECTRQCYPDAVRLKLNHIIRWAEPKMHWRKPMLLARHFVLGRIL